jgi:hypothetical protein
VFQKVQKDSLGHVPQKLNVRYANNYGAVLHEVQRDSLGHLPKNLNDKYVNNYGAVFHKVQKHPLGHVLQKLNVGSGKNCAAVFQKVQENKVPHKLNDRYVNNYGDGLQRVQKDPVGQIPQKPVRWVKRLDRGGEGLYTNCDCRRRNGLQDDCRLTLCHGRPQCLTDPPTCLPSNAIWYN